MERHEMYEVNVDKFADLMMRHSLENGVDTVRLYIKAMQGEGIRPTGDGVHRRQAEAVYGGLGVRRGGVAARG